MNNREIKELQDLIGSHSTMVVFEDLSIADIPALIDALNSWLETHDSERIGTDETSFYVSPAATKRDLRDDYADFIADIC